MKILIADDEELVRENLKDILRGMALGNELYEAVNGRTLIERVHKFKPDICFVDIRMPGISGLEAIEELSLTYPDISWIILSGYSDFEYARKAIGLGVLDYLLKPATESEVEDALTRATEKRLYAGSFRREKFEYRVSGVLNNSSSDEFDDFLQQLPRYAALVFIPGNTEQGIMLEQQRSLIKGLRTLLDQNPPHDYAGIFNILDGYPAIIAAGDKPAELLRELKSTLSYELQTAVCPVYTPDLGNLSELMNFFENSLEINERGQPGEENPDKSSRIVRQAEKLVLEQFTEPIGVAQIADELNVTPNYLSSLFKKYKQVSFTKFITDIRLNEAPKILKTPGITVKEASRHLGYMSSRHFARLFREKYGMTPTDYISRN